MILCVSLLVTCSSYHMLFLPLLHTQVTHATWILPFSVSATQSPSLSTLWNKYTRSTLTRFLSSPSLHFLLIFHLTSYTASLSLIVISFLIFLFPSSLPPAFPAATYMPLHVCLHACMPACMLAYLPVCLLPACLRHLFQPQANPLGTGGAIAETYSELLQDLWCGKYSASSPEQFKVIWHLDILHSSSTFTITCTYPGCTHTHYYMTWCFTILPLPHIDIPHSQLWMQLLLSSQATSNMTLKNSLHSSWMVCMKTSTLLRRNHKMTCWWSQREEMRLGKSQQYVMKYEMHRKIWITKIQLQKKWWVYLRQ